MAGNGRRNRPKQIITRITWEALSGLEHGARGTYAIDPALPRVPGSTEDRSPVVGAQPELKRKFASEEEHASHCRQAQPPCDGV